MIHSGSRSPSNPRSPARRTARRARWSLAALALACALALGSAARGDDAAPAKLRIHGAGVAELTLDAAALGALPRTKLKAAERGGAEAEFEGVALSALLERAGVPLGEQLRGPALGLGVLVQAADGYRALFSVAELDPRMTQRVVLLADRRDGAALSDRDGPLKLVVPGEGRPARWVRQVIALEIVCAGGTDASACRPSQPH